MRSKENLTITASDLINTYPFIKDNFTEFVNSLYPLFLQDWIKLHEEIQKYGDFLNLNDQELFEMIVFSMQAIHTIDEIGMWEMSYSSKSYKIADNFRKQIIQYSKDKNIWLPGLLDNLVTLMDFRSQSISWDFNLRSTLYAYLNGKIQSGDFDKFELKIKCKDCDEEFTLSVDEQKFYTSRNFEIPKRCNYCRKERRKQLGRVIRL